MTDSWRDRFQPADNGCLEWIGGRNATNYGKVKVNRHWWLAHRLVWTDAHGAIPDGMDVLHRCDNPPCCNLDHLFLGTHADNMADMSAKGRAAHRLDSDAIFQIMRDTRPARVIAKQYGVSAGHVRKVRAGCSWRLSAVRETPDA